MAKGRKGENCRGEKMGKDIIRRKVGKNSIIIKAERNFLLDVLHLKGLISFI
jgi:hypothetical protein